MPHSKLLKMRFLFVFSIIPLVVRTNSCVIPGSDASIMGLHRRNYADLEDRFPLADHEHGDDR